ncbi:MAG: tagaturonate reductase [Bacteroidetes bacterium]|nr:tagaturonate reductase [Bacteroidota bacterium]
MNNCSNMCQQTRRLNRQFLREHQLELKVTTIGSLEPMPERVLQFGEGNFLRAFVEWHFHEMNRKGLFKGSVVVVQPLETGMVHHLNEQEGCYTLLRRGLQNGEPVEETDVITIISRGLNPYTQYDEYLRCAMNPDLRYIVSNTTEAGIEYHAVPFPEGRCPKTFPAKLAIFLYERFKYFNGDPSKGFIVLPCELIKKNGYTLRQCILHHAIDWNLETKFIEWVKEHNVFCDTLVDRIVPGYPKDEITVIEAKLGYHDSLLVASELFHLWVIQADRTIARELPFTEAGLNVVWTEDLTPHRSLKVRILNGTHTMFSIPSFLAGVDTVLESLRDPLIGKVITKGLYEEILPTLDMPDIVKKEYAATVLERFKNPYIKHLLQSINMNSVSKFRVRVLPSLTTYYEQRKVVPPILSLSLAALIVYYKSTRESTRASVGLRNGIPYVINDDNHVLEFFAQRRELYENNLKRLCEEVLSNITFWDRDLTTIDGLTSKVHAYVEMIERLGIRVALQQVVP